ncbi:flavin reductase family protein [Segnochrobactraceae bacterium EtOH-i3]
MSALSLLTKPAPSDSFVDPAAFRAGMREFAAGVTIITTGAGAERRGLTATAVCSMSIEPPSLVACVQVTAAAHAEIVRSGRFAVNMLAADQEPLARRFAGMTGVHGAERFDEGNWTTLETGVPVLADAVTAFDCVVIAAIDRGTHTLFIGGVKAVRTDAARPSLIHRSAAFTTLA